MTKHCTKHGLIAQEDIIKGGTQSGKQRYRCGLCAKERLKKFYKNNTEKVLKIRKEWRENNPEKVKISKRLSLIKNREKQRLIRREAQRRYHAKHPETKRLYNKNKISNLYDSYIIDMLCSKSNLISKDIPHALIELKRSHVLLKRMIKEKEND